MAKPLPELDKPARISGAADAWDDGLTGALLSADYFADAITATGTLAVTEEAGGTGEFGSRVDGADSFPQSDDRVLVSSFTLSETATITAIGTRCTAGAGGGGNWWGVIYEDSAGTPGTRLAITAARTFPAGPAEITGAVSPGVVLGPGTYWIGSACNGTYDAPWDHQTGSGTLKRGEGFSPSGNWPGGGSDYTSTLTAWAEYEVAGGDDFAADGEVTSGGGATGTLAATESGTDALASTGGVLVQGAQSATEAGADTLAASGDVFVQGAVALSEAGADVLASSGDVIAQGALAASEAGSDAFGSEGDVFASGSMAAVESGADAFAASGVDEQPAPVAAGGGSLSYEDAEAIYNRQTQRKALPDVDAQPQQKASTEAQGATEGPTGAPASVVFADAFTAPASLPSLADVRAAIAEAQQAAQRAASTASAIQLQRIVQEAQAAELAEEEAVAMLVLMMEAA